MFMDCIITARTKLYFEKENSRSTKSGGTLRVLLRQQTTETTNETAPVNNNNINKASR